MTHLRAWLIGAFAAVLVAGSGVAVASPQSPAPPAVPLPSAGADGSTPRAEPPRQDLSRIKAKALAPAQTNTVFVPIASCRIVHTGNGTGANGTPFTNGATRSYVVSGTTGFEAQGGKAGGCGIPASATAVSATVVALSPSKVGYVRAWAAGGTEPTANVLNYGAFTMGSGSTIAVRPQANPSLTVKNYAATAGLVIDVSGYFLPPMHGMVAPGTAADAPIYAGSSRIISATNPSPGVYQVKFDGNVTYCTPVVDTYNAGAGVYGAAYAFSTDTVTVYTWYLSSTTHLEVPYSFYVYVAVIC